MKPAHLAQTFGDQFQDMSVAEHYRKRPAYPSAVFELLTRELARGAAIVDLGCGTGELTIPLAKAGFRMTGVDPSEAMLLQARLDAPDIDWYCGYAEEFDFPEPIDCVIAGNSLHWMDWPVLFRKLAPVLGDSKPLVLVTGGEMFGFSAQADVLPLVQRYSTNQSFRPYSLTDMLSEAGYVRVDSSEATRAVPVQQSLAEFIDAFHARNGFSLERMSPDNARTFRDKLQQVLEPTLIDGCVHGYVQASVHYCTVLPASDGMGQA